MDTFSEVNLHPGLPHLQLAVIAGSANGHSAGHSVAGLRLFVLGKLPLVLSYGTCGWMRVRSRRVGGGLGKNLWRPPLRAD